MQIIRTQRYLLSFLLVIPVISLIWPNFMYGNTVYCDSWFYFAQNFIMEDLAKMGFDYKNDRIPAYIIPHYLNKILTLHWARLLTTWVLFAGFVYSLYFFIKAKYSESHAKLTLPLIALNPLTIGALDFDYVAMEALIFILISLFFVQKAKSCTSLKDYLKYMLVASILFVFGIHCHFKVGIFSLFVLIYLYLEKDILPWKKRTILNSLTFLTGSVVGTAIIGILNKILFGGPLYFFKDQIIATKSDEYYRQFEEIFRFSSGFMLYIVTLGFLMALILRKKWSPLIVSLLITYIFLGVWWLSGGSLFIESNYVWLLPGLILAFVELLTFSEKNIKKYLCLIFAISIPLLLTKTLFVQTQMFNEFGPWSLIVFPLGGLLIGLILTSQYASERKVTFSIIVATLIFSTFRPDLLSGRNLYTSRPDPNSSANYYNVLAKGLKEMSRKGWLKVEDGRWHPVFWVDRSENHKYGRRIGDSMLYCDIPYSDYEYPVKSFRVTDDIRTSQYFVFISPTLDKPTEDQLGVSELNFKVKWLDSFELVGKEKLYFSYGMKED